MKLKYHFLYILMCIVLAFALAWSLNRNCNVESIIECKTDTLVFEKIDTIVEYNTIYKDRKVIDTIYIETKTNDILTLPVVQKRYSNPNVLDLWISGVEPLNVDSFKTYNTTQYKVITNTVTNVAMERKPKFYVSGGLNAFSRTFSPNMNISLTTKEKWLFSLEIGLDANSKVYYGGKAGIRIN